MYGLPQGVVALSEEPYNVEQQVSWNCYYPSNELAAQVLADAFRADIDPVVGVFKPLTERPSDGRARITWEFGGDTFQGEVLVDSSLRPVGFIVEIAWKDKKTLPQDMVFNLYGHHIPGYRFNAADPKLENLVY